MDSLTFNQHHWNRESKLTFKEFGELANELMKDSNYSIIEHNKAMLKQLPLT